MPTPSSHTSHAPLPQRPRTKFGRRCQLAFAVASLAAILCSGQKTDAQDAKPTREVIADIVLTTAQPDATEIHITYFQQDSGKETPVVVLLPAEGSNRQVWGSDRGGFAKRLWDQGYAVVAVDLRKHGQSVVTGPTVVNEITPGDRRAMVAYDMEAVKQFLFKEHMTQRLNMNKTAIIAPEASAAVAIEYTILDWSKAPYDDGIRTPRGQDIRCLILLSPERNPEGLSTGRALPVLGRLAASELPAREFSMLFMYGTEDNKDRDTRRMYRMASAVKGSKERVLLSSYNYKLRGLELIGANNQRTKAEEHMLGFLRDHLQRLSQSPWRDRRSRFDR